MGTCNPTLTRITLMLLFPLLTASMLHAQLGAWQAGEKVDPITDERNAYVFNMSNDGPVLFLRCMGGRTDVFIDWRDYLGSDDCNSVTYRVANDEPQKECWLISTDRKKTFSPDFLPSLFAARLLMAEAKPEKRTFAARTTPHAESPVTAVFNLKGLAAKVRALKPECPWLALAGLEGDSEH